MQLHRKSRVVFALFTLAAAILLGSAAGCAAIIHGSLQRMAIRSTPPGATVTLDGASVGTTPLTTSLSRKNEHVVHLELQGYKPIDVRLNKKIDGWFWGNLLLGGLVGMVIDGSTGAMYKLSPGQVKAALEQSGMSLRTGSDQLMIGVTLTPDPAWQRIGQLEPDSLP